MTVFVFIVESGNTEEFDSTFINREIDNINVKEYKENMNIESIENMIYTVSEKFKDSVFTVFVDQQYQLQYYYTDKGLEEHDRIKTLEEMSETVKVCRCNWMDFIPNFDGIDDSSHYIFMTSKKFKNAYDMANYLQLPLNNNCYFLWNSNDIIDAVDAKCYYNIFSSIKRINQINSLNDKVIEDEEAIKWIVEYGISQIKQMIKAGILAKEAFIQRNVENWAINPYSYFSKGIIIEYEMKPKPPLAGDPKILKGLLIIEEFNRSSEYRFQILDIMMKIICKYGLEFNKITTINGNHHTVNFDFILN